MCGDLGCSIDGRQLLSYIAERSPAEMSACRGKRRIMCQRHPCASSGRLELPLPAFSKYLFFGELRNERCGLDLIAVHLVRAIASLIGRIV